jgi:Domain of unknown function (DUF5916)/Carbohydrate family 9 binding domain-like
MERRTIANAVLLILVLIALQQLAAAPATAQASPGEEGARVAAVQRPLFTAGRANSKIEVDGVLDESGWEAAARIPVAVEWFPGDNVTAPVETVAFLTYDDDNIYVGFEASDPEPEKIRAHLMDRDQIFTFVQDDHVTLQLDTFDDERRAFQFRVNPLGIQADAIFSQAEGVEDFSWDIIWESAGRIHEGGYTIEIALPVSQLRFPGGGGVQTWGVDLGRSWPRDSRHRIAAARLDRNNGCILCQVPRVTGIEGLEPGRNLEVDPTVTATRTDRRDVFPHGPLEAGDPDYDPGLSVRWGVTPDLTLNATIRPDFSQVEADAAQLDVNERFALFFPEKRPFFLEAIDLFSTPLQAVFTRTVADPEWGLKLTGKIDRNALGLFATKDEVNSLLIPSNQGSRSVFLEQEIVGSVLRYRRDLGRNSSIGALYAGREGDEYHNRVAGLDGFVRLSGTDTLAVQYLRSQTLYPEAVVEAFGQSDEEIEGGALELSYRHGARNWLWNLDVRDRDREFRADSGFVPRVDIREAEGGFTRRLWGEPGSWYDQIDLHLSATHTEDQGGQLTDEELQFDATFRGGRQSVVQVGAARKNRLFRGVRYEELEGLFGYFEFQPTGVVKATLYVQGGETVDVNNNQPADELLLNPTVELKLGRHVNLGLDHFLQRLESGGKEVLTANLSQLKLIYNFNPRMLVRGIFQYLAVDRDPAQWRFPVEAETETLFSQLLFSYKLNPLTVLFVGYADNRLGLNDGLQDYSLTQTDRTIFVKLGYAFQL